MNILVIGAGRMGGALLTGCANSDDLSARIVAVDRNIASVGFPDNVTPVLSADDIPRDFRPDTIVIATKPQKVIEAIRNVDGFIGACTTLVSLAAGVSIETIEACIGRQAAIVRVMPNIGASLGHSVTAGFPSDATSHEQKDVIQHLFEAVGSFNWLEQEDDLHLVTGLSGSGPAYYFAFCEAMIAAAIKAGVNDDLAKNLCVGTAVCSGQLLNAAADPRALRQAVTSPNGTTAAGLEALMDGGRLAELAEQTIRAAAQRSRELS